MTTLTSRLPRTLSLLQTPRSCLSIHKTSFPPPSTTLLPSKRKASTASAQQASSPKANTSPPRKPSQIHTPPPSRPSAKSAPRNTVTPPPNPKTTTKPTTKHATTSPSTSPPASQAADPPPSKLNGPISTLPAPLNVPSRSPDQGLPKYLFTVGKTYLTFYKTGVKYIYANYRSARPIQHLIDTQHNHSLSAAVSTSAITRSEFQLLARNWHDIKRVPIFGLVFAVCGEFTPLVVVLVSNVVPWTCRIPKQINSDRMKLESRRRISFRNLTLPPPAAPTATTAEDRKDGKGLDGEGSIVDGLHRMQALHINWNLGLSSSIWDWLGGQLPGLPTFVLRRRVKRRVEYLYMDDKLIKECGGVGGLSEEEVKMACVERGIDTVGRGEREVRGDLEGWMKSREKEGVVRLLLTRPSVWPFHTSHASTAPKITSPPSTAKNEKRKKVYV